MLESLRIPEKLFSVAAWALSLCGPLATAMRVEGTEDFYHVRAFAAESTVHIVSGKWYDGSWWEIDIPEPWSVTETSNQHIRFTNAGAKVLIGFRHHHRVHEASKRDAWAKANLAPEQEAAYSSAKAESEMSWWRFPLQSPFSTGSVERTDISELIGWTYVAWSDYSTKKWAGFFTQEPWSLYVRLESPAADLEAHKATVKTILASIRFRT